MGNGPDFTGYNQYLNSDTQDGVQIVDGGLPGTDDDYVIIDYEQIRNSDVPAQTLVDKFTAVAEERFNELSGDITAEQVFSIADIEAARAGTPMLTEHGGGHVFDNQKILRLDPQTATLQEFASDIVGQDLPDTVFTQTEEELFALYVKEHENAHLFLDLNEAGSDYVASVRLLQERPGPETEAFLQKIADLREVAPYRAIPPVAGITALKYGYGCTTAIEAALVTKDELEGLSVEAMYDNATTYDGLNGIIGSIRPEMSIRNAMLTENPDLLRGNFNEGDVSATAQKLLDQETFEPGSKEVEILEELVDAADRIENSFGGIEETRPTAPSLDSVISNNNDSGGNDLTSGPG